MNLLNIYLIAIGLSMDAFAVSITNGLIIKEIKIRHAFRIAFSFALFQAGMPILGWVGGLTFRNYIESIDHWIAFGLLTLIGSKMIYESFVQNEDETICKERSCLNPKILLLMSIATSIDALAVGITFAVINIEIITPIIIIGCITFIFCFAGIYIGSKAGHFFEKRIETIGGIILIAIGLKILIESYI